MFMLLVLAALTCLAADAATFAVPCNQPIAVDALLFDNGTTFLISGCSGVDAATSAPLMTYFQVRFDMALPTQIPPSAVSVIVVDSVNVAILILGNRSFPQSVEGLSITFRNVTNVATSGMPMLHISGIGQLKTMHLVFTHVAYPQSTTFMIKVESWAAIQNGLISISSCFFAGVEGILQIIPAVVSTSATIASTNISISNCSVELVGAALQPGLLYPAVLLLRDANVAGSHIVLDTINITDSLGSGNVSSGPNIVMCLVTKTTAHSATSLVLRNFTISLQSEVSARLCYLSNTTMSHFASLEIVDALILGGQSPPYIVVLQVSTSSAVSSSRVVLQDITVHCSQFIGSCSIVTMRTADLLHRFTVRLADSMINATGSFNVVSIANSALNNGSLVVENVWSETRHSQPLSIAITTSSVENAELLLNNVTVVEGYSALCVVDAPVVSNTTITMAYCLCSAYLFAYFSNTTFWNTTVVVHRPMRSPAASLGIDQCLIQSGSQWMLELPTITSGQMMFARNVTISDVSTIVVDASNATITREASFTGTLFILQGIRLEGISTFLVRLPQILERRSPESAEPPVYLSDNVITGGSHLVVQGLSELLWTTVLWATSSIFQIQSATIEDGASMLVCYFEFQNINNASTTTSRGILVYNATVTNGGTMRFASLMMRLDLTRATAVGSDAVSEMMQLEGINARQSSTGVIVEDATCVHDVNLFTRCIYLNRVALSAGAHFTTRNVSATVFATSQFIWLSDCSASTGAAIAVAQYSRIVLTFMGSLYPVNREVNVVVVINSVFSTGSTLTVLEGAFMSATNQSMAPAASTISVLRLYNTSVVDSNLTLRNVVVLDLCLPDVSSSVQVVNVSGASIIARGAAVSLEGISIDCPHASLLQSAVDTHWGDTVVATQLLILQRIVAARSEALVVLSGHVMGHNITVGVSQSEFKDVSVIVARLTSPLNTINVAIIVEDASFTASATNPQQIVSLSVSAPSVYHSVTFTRATVVSPWSGGRPSSGCRTTTTSAALQCPTVLVSVPSTGATPAVRIVVDDTLIIGDALLFSAAPEVIVDAQVFCSRWGRHIISAPSWITMYSPPIAGATRFFASSRPVVNVTLYPYSIANRTLSCPLSQRLNGASPSIILTASVTVTHKTSTATQNVLKAALQVPTSFGGVSAVAGVASVASATSAASLVRSFLIARLANCDVDDILAGGSDEGLFHVVVGDGSAPGSGYRSQLVDLMLVVAIFGAAGAAAAVVARARRRQPWASACAAVGMPGWWLAGPCAASVAPLLASGVSLAAVSRWEVPAADAILVLLSLLALLIISAVCMFTLTRSGGGGYFVCTAVMPEARLFSRNAPAHKRALSWLVDGGFVWAVDRRKAPAVKHFVQHYGALFTAMRPGRHWYFLVDGLGSVVAGLVVAVPAVVLGATGELSSAVCLGALHTATAVQWLAAAAFVVLSPIAVRWEYWSAALMTLLGVVSATLTSAQASDSVVNAIGVTQLVVSGLLTLMGLIQLVVMLSAFGRWRGTLGTASEANNPLKLPYRHFRKLKQRSNYFVCRCVDVVPQTHTSMAVLIEIVVQICEQQRAGTFSQR